MPNESIEGSHCVAACMARRILIISAILSVLLPSSAGVAYAASCSDTTHTAYVWYTMDGWSPNHDLCEMKIPKPHTMGRCLRWFKCRTDHCGWGDWRTGKLRLSLEQAQAEYGEYYGPEEDPSSEPSEPSEPSGDLPDECEAGTRLRLWGATIDAEDTKKTLQDRWRYAPGGEVKSSPAIGSDGTIYIDSQNGLDALDPVDGTLKWRFPHGGPAPQISPAVGPDGTVYFSVDSTPHRLYAIDPEDGSEVWHVDLEPSLRVSSPAIEESGERIYVASLVEDLTWNTGRGLLYSIDANGAIVWTRELTLGDSFEIDLANFDIREITDPVIGGDGTVYLGTWKSGENLYSVSRDGSRVSGFRTRSTGENLAIDDDGTVYVPGTSGLIEVIRWDGSREAPYDTQLRIRSGLAIKSESSVWGRNVTLYVGGTSGEFQAIRDGVYDWEVDVGRGWKIFATPAIAADGTIYVGTAESKHFCALDPRDGDEKWCFKTGGSIYSSPAIGTDGTIYVGSKDGNLYAFYGHSALAESSWPMAQGGPRHSGQGRRGLLLSRSSHDFGTAVDTPTTFVTFTVKNHSDTEGTITGIGITGDSADFLMENDCAAPGPEPFPYALSAAESCEIGVAFDPQSVGRKTATLEITPDPHVPVLTIELKGRLPGPTIELLDESGALVSRVDFGVHDERSSTPKTLTIRSAGIDDLSIHSIDLAGAGFRLVPPLPDLGSELAPGNSAHVTVAFEPSESGLATGTLGIVSNDPLRPYVPVTLYGHGGDQNVSYLIGHVIEDDTGKGIAAAQVRLGQATSTTSTEETKRGFYRLGPVTSGGLSVEKSGYLPWNETVDLPPSATVFHEVRLSSTCNPDYPQPLLVGLTSQYPENVTYVADISHEVEYTAQVNWCGLAPGEVVFRGPRWTARFDVNAVSGGGVTETPHTMDMGRDFTPCGKLQVQAIASDGTRSRELVAPFRVMRRPFPRLIALPDGLDGVATVDSGDAFRYESTLGLFTVPLLDQAKKTDKKVPFLGGKHFFLDWIPAVTQRYESDGSWKVRLAWSNLDDGNRLGWGSDYGDEGGPSEKQKAIKQYLDRHPGDKDKTPKFKFFGGVTAVAYPILDIDGVWLEDHCANSWGGQAGLIVDFNANFVVYFGAVPGLYFKGLVDLMVVAEGGVVPDPQDPETIKWTGSVTVSPSIEAALGYGLSECFAVEGWMRGGLDWTVLTSDPNRFCSGDNLTACLEDTDCESVQLGTCEECNWNGYVKGGVRVYAWIFTWEHEVARWTFGCGTGRRGSAIVLSADSSFGPRMVSREYAKTDRYAAFHAAAGLQSRQGFGSGDDAALPEPVAIQESVFPYSESHLSSAAAHLDLVWLYDDTPGADPAVSGDGNGRSALNRTTVIFSRYDSSTGEWSNPPVAVADDGTADFHPEVLSFSNGETMVAWENLSEILTDPGAELDPCVTPCQSDCPQECLPVPDPVPPDWPEACRACLSCLNECKYDEMRSKTETATAFYHAQGDPPVWVWEAAPPLTDNDHLDHRPRLAGPDPANLVMVWISNAGNHPEGSPEHPNTVWYSKSSRPDPALPPRWSEPVAIAQIADPLLKYALAYDGEVGYLLMSVDTDQESKVCMGDPTVACEQTTPDCDDVGGECSADASIGDRELFLLRYDDVTASWSSPEGTQEPMQLTVDDVPDGNPQLAIEGERFILVWLKGGNLVNVRDLTGWLAERDVESVETILEDQFSANLADFKLASGTDGLALVWLYPSEHDSDIYAALYDGAHDVWGTHRQLVDDPEAESYLAGGLYRDATGETGLVVVYDRTEILEVPAKDPNDDTPDVERGGTDLSMLVYPFLDDLALEERTLEASPSHAGAGDPVALRVEVHNVGGTAVDRVAVRFYADGEAIGTTEVVGTDDPPLESGGWIEAILNWTVPATATEGLEISAEVDPDSWIDDANRENNVATSLRVGIPDLAVIRANWEVIAEARYAISARVQNQGTAPARSTTGEQTRVRITIAGQDETLLDEAIPELEPGQSYVVSLELDGEPESYEPITLELFAEPVAGELNESNNLRHLVITPRPPDFTPPEIVVPEPMILEATGPYGAIAEFSSSASDDFSGAVAVDCAPPSGSAFQLGVTMVICTASDFAGNTAQTTFSVTVQDTTPPVLDGAPPDITAECDAVPDPLPIPANDLYDGPVEALFDEARIDGDCEGRYTLIRSWVATDTSGNVGSHSQTVAVIDSTPPEASPPDGISLECNTFGGVARADSAIADWLSLVTATDNCSTWTTSHDAPALFEVGTTTTTFSALDSCGNVGLGTSTITVVDTTAPELEFYLAPIILWPPNHQMRSVHAFVQASDICSEPIVALSSMTSNEPDDAAGDGDGSTIDDIRNAELGAADFDFQLRAERAGDGDGRAYTIQYLAADAQGNQVSRSSSVVVPHDLGGGYGPPIGGQDSSSDPLTETFVDNLEKGSSEGTDAAGGAQPDESTNPSRTRTGSDSSAGRERVNDRRGARSGSGESTEEENRARTNETSKRERN